MGQVRCSREIRTSGAGSDLRPDSEFLPHCLTTQTITQDLQRFEYYSIFNMPNRFPPEPKDYTELGPELRQEIATRPETSSDPLQEIFYRFGCNLFMQYVDIISQGHCLTLFSSVEYDERAPANIENLDEKQVIDLLANDHRDDVHFDVVSPLMNTMTPAGFHFFADKD